MNSVFQLLFISLFSSTLLAAPAPGVFDNYILALSYENDFCASKPARKECRQGGGQAGLVLHGLWPNQLTDRKHEYQYCELDRDVVEKNWCASETDITAKLDREVIAQLEVLMPGSKSCLHNHEWYAHGVCSQLEMNTYFKQALELTRRFIHLPGFQSFLVRAAGKSVTRDEILAALVQGFGSEILDSAVILCRKDNRLDKAYFSEIRISLGRDHLDKFPEKSSLERMNLKDLGNCPVDSIFITP